jgi:hypothetical protein
MNHWKVLLVALMAALLSCMALGDNLYGGIWLSGSGTQQLVLGETWNGFVNQWSALSGANMKLVDMEVYNDANDGSLRFNGVFRPGTFGHYLFSGFTWSQLTAKWDELSKQGYRLVNVETYVEGGVRKYAVVFHEGSDGYYLWNADWNSFTAKWNELSGSMRLVDVEPYLDTDGVVKYIGVWRSGSGGHYLWTANWSGFTSKYNELTGLQLTVFKTVTDNSGARSYVGVWRDKGSAQYLWSGVDKENFLAKNNELASGGLRLAGIVTYSGSCSSSCTNLVVCGCSGYNYMITGTSNFYRNPVDTISGMKFARLSALSGNSQIFKLPFSDTSVKRINGWLYGTNSWHHAIDYSIDGKTSFAIKAAAAGVVEFIGWDTWSGNTVIVRHDSAEGTDTYRTVYMHVRNGPSNDCGLAWSKSIPSISGSDLTNYKNHLIASGCAQDPALRNPNADHWGTNSQKIPVSVGQSVAQGQIIAYSGQTGPGGSLGGGGGSNTNNHLHIFFTRKDKTNNEFYFVDPYGIYGIPSCYPNPIVGPYPASQNICARYSILFKNGYPQYS